MQRKRIYFIVPALAVVSFLAYSFDEFWNGPRDWQTSRMREPASSKSILPPSLTTIRMAADQVENKLVESAITVAARTAIPPLLNYLDLDEAVKARIRARLKSTDFGDKIVPFLLNSVSLYHPTGERVPKSFRDVILPKISDFAGVPGLYHALFKAEETKAEKDKKSGEKSSSMKAKKALVSMVLRMYDALYLQTNLHVGNGVPRLSTDASGPTIANVPTLTPAHLKQVGESFTAILRSLQASQSDNKDAVDAINSILKDEEKKDTVTLTIARFVFEFIERHYQVYLDPLKREYALRQWTKQKLDAFYKNGDPELFRFLEWEAVNKHFAVQITVDGLQGTLMESLTGNNPTFLKQIALEAQNPAQYYPKGETYVTAPFKSQTTFLTWAAANPARLGHPEYLPFFKRLYRESRNSIVRSGISTTPTISVRNIPIVASGADVVGPVHSTNVPNFHYVDRRGYDRDDHLARAYYFFGNDAILLPEITSRKDMKVVPGLNGMKTMFERIHELGLDSMSCHNTYDRGATVAFDPFLNLSIGETVRDFGEIACYAEIADRLEPEKKLQKVRERLLRLISGINEYKGDGWLNKLKWKLTASNIEDALAQYVFLSQKGFPTYLQIYSPWPDHFAHFQGPFSDAIISPTGELNRLDRWLTLLQSLYDRSGLNPRVRFGMAGDHGLTPVYAALNPEVEVFKKFEEETKIALKVLKISSDEGEGPKVNHPNHPPAVKGYDLIIASTAGGNYMVDAFIDQTPANWVRQPVLKDLEQLRTISGHTINLIDMIASRLPESLDYLAVRDSECSPARCSMSVISKRGGKEMLRDRILRVGDRLYYDAKADLLGVRFFNPYRTVDRAEQSRHVDLLAKCVDKADVKAPATWCTSEEWRALSFSTPRPDSVVQLAHLYDSEKAGTINLFPRQGVGFNTKVPGRHAGEHFHEKDAFVGYWGAGLKRSSRLETSVNGSIAPTLMEWLTPAVNYTGSGEFGFPGVPGGL